MKTKLSTEHVSRARNDRAACILFCKSLCQSCLISEFSRTNRFETLNASIDELWQRQRVVARSTVARTATSFLIYRQTGLLKVRTTFVYRKFRVYFSFDPSSSVHLLKVRPAHRVALKRDPSAPHLPDGAGPEFFVLRSVQTRFKYSGHDP